jgi:hypothetical protein
MADEKHEGAVPEPQQLDITMETTASDEPAAINTPKFLLVLNDGKQAVDSATVPLRWFFPKEVLDRKPTDLLMIVQHEAEYDSWDCGERFRVKVKDGMTWLPFSRAGRHRIMVFALTHEGTGSSRYEARMKEFMRKSGPRRYESWGIKYDEYLITYWVGMAETEVEIPAGFFAKKPRGLLGTLLWNWVNWGHEWEAPDQCTYRRRLLVALTLKPFGWLALRAVQVGLGAFFGVILVITSLFFFCIGRRPRYVGETVLKALCWELPASYDIKDNFPHDWMEWNRGKKFIPPIVYAAVAAAAYGIYRWFEAGLPWGWFVLTLGACGLSGWLTYVTMKAITERKAEEYGDYLTREFNAERSKELLARKPKTGLVRKLVMSYEALKAEWCKPFEK